MKDKPLSVADRKSLVAKALNDEDNEGITASFLESLPDDKLRMFADALTPEESAESERDMDSDDWSELNERLAGLSSK